MKSAIFSKHLTILTSCALGLACGFWAAKSESSQDVPTLEDAQSNQSYKGYLEEAAQLKKKKAEGEDWSEADVLLENVIDARNRAEEIVGKEIMDLSKNRSGLDAELDFARSEVQRVQPQLADSITKYIGSDPTVSALVQSAFEDEANGPKPAKYVVAATRAMGDAALKNLMEIGKQNPEMVIVFRGLMPGEKIDDLIRFLAKLQPPKEGESLANVTIDPTVFSEYSITTAPTILRLDEAGKAIAEARGVANPRWLEDRILVGERGDLGVHGPTTAIAERDLIEVMQERYMAGDTESRFTAMKDNFWKNQKFNLLPKAKKNRVREVDPSVVVVDGIYGPDGSVIAYPGQKLNPFDAIPFDMHVLVFDGGDADQVAWARKKVVELDGKPITVVTTRVDSERGWDSYVELTNTIGRQIYLLPPEFVERFRLENVPSIVEGGNRVLIVSEFALDPDSEKSEG